MAPDSNIKVPAWEFAIWHARSVVMVMVMLVLIGTVMKIMTMMTLTLTLTKNGPDF